MKLEPIYLVAPKPVPKSMPTRRAFLLAAACGIGGACGGAFGGYALARTGVDSAASSLDADVSWAVDLLRTGTDSELMESFAGLTGVLGDHPEAVELRPGLVRLTRVAIATPQSPLRRLQLTSLVGMLERPDFADCAATLGDIRAALR